MGKKQNAKFENRLTRCDNCNETLTYRYKVTPEQGEDLIIKLSCPFCNTKLQVDLNPYSRKQINLLRSPGGSGTENGNEAKGDNSASILELPPELPTTTRE